MRLTQGWTIDGRYEVEGLIAEGGMAAVYRGRDRILGRPVAIKVLAAHLAADPAFVARFEREARAAAALNHPNVVPVYDAGLEDGRHYIVMEYVEGHTLGDVLRERGALAPEEALRIASAVSAGLAAAHARGIVHRDVKPGNVLCTADGSVKVTDFGIAHMAESATITQTATLVGTASYLSPEQASGRPVDARSDVYSLGCVLYEMLAGRPPFTGESPIAVAQQHITAEPPPLPEAIPAHLRSTVERAMRKDPAERFADASAVRAAITGTTVSQAPYLRQDDATQQIQRDPTEVLPRPARRRPRVPLWLAVALLAVIAGGSVLAMQRDPSERADLVRSPAPRATEAPQAVTTPVPTAAPTPVDPAAGLFAQVHEGSTRLEIQQRTARELNDRLQKIFEAQAKGDTKTALRRVEDTQKWLEERAERGEIQPARAQALIEMLDMLARGWDDDDDRDD